jgi:peroxiredoxin
MPDFDLPNTNADAGADRVTAGDLRGRVAVVMVICNHCPFVIHVREQLAAIGRDYADRAAIIAISANDIRTHPADAPDKMTAFAAESGFNFPYLFDESQATAKALGAACTPDFYVFDESARLTYRGQLDDARPGNGQPVTGADLRRAIDATLDGDDPIPDQRPSIGCNIKWTPGNEPAYFARK